MEITLPDGRKVQATEVEVKTAKELWNEYELEDGNILKMKLVLVKVLKTSDKDIITGVPIYIVNTQNLMVTSKKEK